MSAACRAQVRRVVDEAGRSLPRGSAVQGLLYDEARYERADTSSGAAARTRSEAP